VKPLEIPPGKNPIKYVRVKSLWSKNGKPLVLSLHNKLHTKGGLNVKKRLGGLTKHNGGFPGFFRALGTNPFVGLIPNKVSCSQPVVFPPEIIKGRLIKPQGNLSQKSPCGKSLKRLNVSSSCL